MNSINLKINKQKEIYDSCEHIWIFSRVEHDNYDGRKYCYCGCMKCGLDESYIETHEYSNDNDSIEAMLAYTKENPDYLNKGTLSKYACDINLARGIYNKIKENNPDIDDETAKKYFEISLDHIRNINISNKRKISRAKRLNLYPNFNRWESYDVHKKVN